MIDYVKKIFSGQFEASLAMLGQCVEKCPDDDWNGKIAKYEFWHVAYHTLCCTDMYLAPSHESFQPCEFHPLGMDELTNEFPSRELSKEEISAYLIHCREKAVSTLAAETSDSLASPTKFYWLSSLSRGELHIYSIRHVMHHTGQLSAYLRRAGIDTDWVKSGWQ